MRTSDIINKIIIAALLPTAITMGACSSDDITGGGDAPTVVPTSNGSRSDGAATGHLRFEYLINRFGDNSVPDGIDQPHVTRTITTETLPHMTELSRYDTLGVTITTADTTYSNMKFAPDADGLLAYCDDAAKEPVWADISTFDVKAYYPYNATAGATFAVATNQVTDSMFRKSDFLFGEMKDCDIDKLGTLTLLHKVSWWDLDINFSDQLTADELKGAKFAIYGIWTKATPDADTGELTVTGKRGVITFYNVPADNTATEFRGTLSSPPQSLGYGNYYYFRITFADGVKRYFTFEPKVFHTNMRYPTNIDVKNYQQQFTATIEPYEDEDVDGEMTEE